MPRALRTETTFDLLEEDILFTLAALAADPDAEDLLPLTASWLPTLDKVRTQDREVRVAAMTADAKRVVANGRLDGACTRFGDELYLAAGKDRNSPRWTQFFKGPVSKFVRQALASQVLTVQGWLASTDAVLAKHKPELERWANAADEALVKTRHLAIARGENWQRREELCAGLTRERDALHEALAERARDRMFDRGWPDLFFRVRTEPENTPTTPSSSAPEAC